MIAALFPGQGSQSVGMGADFIDQFPVFAEKVEEASDTLGYDMKKLCVEGPADQLQLTEYTQPALVTMEYATYCVVKEKFATDFKAAAGHSVGEYAALVAAGVISFSEALKLVQLRGQLMQKSVPVGDGGMLAIMGLEAEEIRQMCEWACRESQTSPLEPANYNSLSQTVVSGNLKTIDFAIKNFSPDKIGSDKTKVRLIPLKVSAPFHCSMMKKAEQGMAAAFEDIEFKKPSFGIVQNYSGQLETEPQTLKANIIAQVSGAVRWVECMQTLKSQNFVFGAELGPGKVLTGLSKKIDADFECVAVNSTNDLKGFEDKIKAVQQAPQSSPSNNYGVTQ